MSTHYSVGLDGALDCFVGPGDRAWSNGILEPGTDTLLGYGTPSNGTWTLTFSTANWAAAVDTLFAQAKDNYGVLGDPFALTLQVV